MSERKPRPPSPRPEGNPIDTMNIGKHNWEKFGKKDPYYWVTTDSRYKDAKLKKNVQKHFFDSADKYLDSIFKVIQKHLDSSFHPERALDYGCGVGRVTIPLARRCNYVFGVDVAESMIAEAEKNRERYLLNNVDFTARTNSLPSLTDSFDFVHSIYVFQHIRAKQGLKTVIQLIDSLKENGIGMLHFITFQSQKSIKKKIIYWLCVHIPLFNAMNNIRKGQSFSAPMYEMNNYPLNKLFEILREKECSHIYVRHTKEGPYHGVMLFFQKKRGDHDDFTSLGEVL